jgi:hypothetical protein
MFVRAKTIKGKKYGYLVENSWKKGKVKQQVKKYLGKIVDIPNLEEFEAVDVEFKNRKQYISQIIFNDLIQRGFTHDAKKKELTFDVITLSYFPFKVKENNKDVVLNLNKRYVYADLLNELCSFYEPESDSSRPGEKLARAFREAGIQIAKENFVTLYKELYLSS